VNERLLVDFSIKQTYIVKFRPATVLEINTICTYAYTIWIRYKKKLFEIHTKYVATHFQSI